MDNVHFLPVTAAMMYEYCCLFTICCRCGEEHIIPFRESKLTRLFQNYFVGKGGKGVRQGKITMFVNISNTASVFDETMHVLKFSALTSKVRTVRDLKVCVTCTFVLNIYCWPLHSNQIL